MIGLSTSFSGSDVESHFVSSFLSTSGQQIKSVKLDTDKSLSDISTIPNIGFMHCKRVRVICYAKWELIGGREGSITLCPLLQTQEEGLVVSTLPHSTVWLLEREALIGAPSPVKLL